MSSLKTDNPFMHVPEDKLRIIREDFLKSEFAGTMDFEKYLTLLHEEDDTTPEEMLDIIAGRNSRGGRAFYNAKDLIEYLDRDDDGDAESNT